MKKLLYFLAAALLLGCSREEQMNQEELPLTPKVYHVNLAFAGEVANEVEVSRDPLSKAGEVDTNDIYIINVYHKPPLESGYSQYAYGVFDRLENMSLDLYEGTLYQFKATLIKNGRNKLYIEYPNQFYWSTYAGIMGTIDNKFVMNNSWNAYNYHANHWNNFVREGEFYESYQHPIWDRYYGILDDYASDGSSVVIDLYRAVFGAKINVTGLTEGTLSFGIFDSPDVIIRADSLYTPDNIYQMMLPDENMEAIKTGERYSCEWWTSIIWTDATGSRSVKILDGDINYARLERTIFNVTLKQGAVEQGNVEFNIEQEEIADGEIHDLEGSISGVEN